jgi:hypothetical protein
MSQRIEQIEDNKTKGQKIKVFCSDCETSTNHEVMQSVDVAGSERFYRDETDDSSYESLDWIDNYQVIRCQGCDLITFRHLSWFSEDDNDETEYLYPDRSVNTRIEKGFNNLPRQLLRIYRETVDCYNNDSRILCAAGLRAIIEGICSEQNVKDGHIFKADRITPVLGKDGITPVRSESLAGKIAGLYEKNILTKASADILHEHRFLGNDAIHELQLPTREVLGLAMDIIEHMLEDLYEIPEKAEDLRRKRVMQMKKI